MDLSGLQLFFVVLSALLLFLYGLEHASIPMDAFARRSAQMNLLFNTTGVLLVLPFVRPFAEWALAVGGTPSQGVAIAHLAFNLGLAALFLPFTGWLGRRCAPAHRGAALPG